MLIGIGFRALAGLGLWLITDTAGLPAFVPLVLYGVIMVVIPLTDVSGALLAANTSPIGPGGGQGGNGFALAGAAVLGAFIGGWAAEAVGFASLGLIVGVLAVVDSRLEVAVPTGFAILVAFFGAKIIAQLGQLGIPMPAAIKSRLA